jgi:hypothetical protein
VQIADHDAIVDGRVIKRVCVRRDLHHAAPAAALDRPGVFLTRRLDPSSPSRESTKTNNTYVIIGKLMGQEQKPGPDAS